MKKLICSALAGSLLITGGSLMVFADDTQPTAYFYGVDYVTTVSQLNEAGYQARDLVTGQNYTQTVLKTGMVVYKQDGLQNPAENVATLYVRGDVNGDGIISDDDLETMRLYILSEEGLTGCYLKAADMDGNNIINVLDLVLAKNQKLQNTPPAGEDAFDTTAQHFLETTMTCKTIGDWLALNSAYSFRDIENGTSITDPAAVVGTGTMIIDGSERTSMDKAVKTVVMMGDADGNGVVDIEDLELIKYYILSCDESFTGCYWAAADYNHDGVVDVADLMAIKSDIQQAGDVDPDLLAQFSLS
ncbi:dockerin type I repeat-containing protein [Candidatus Soleaferrea massiliensis]|uniref:dockerin type I repeat-containing protein n=1 Tax=Candidatus Soleaferrea massiliensis TaxID=1470354 RepID=UPI0018CCDBA1|nr:dockerin type I repeat-containing protein [Candidatus Soleaferrea massiliensis]